MNQCSLHVAYAGDIQRECIFLGVLVCDFFRAGVPAYDGKRFAALAKSWRPFYSSYLGYLGVKGNMTK